MALPTLYSYSYELVDTRNGTSPCPAARCILPAPASWFAASLDDATWQLAAKSYSPLLQASFRNISAVDSGVVLPTSLAVGASITIPILDDKLPHRRFLSNRSSFLPDAANVAGFLVAMGYGPGSSNQYFSVMVQAYQAYCGGKAIAGEVRACFASKSSMDTYVKRNFPKAKFVKLAKFQSSPTKITLTRIDNMPAIQTICHKIVFPYAVYSCHKIDNTIAIYVEGYISQKPTEKEVAVLICHEDTSSFSRDSPSLRALNMRPGEGAFCHFYAENDLLAIQSSP
ncbi:BURP domain-containing protein 14-like [Selaginella moellendorffii]|nr:BURP domain-containing protein 14-like [Selaginella moellendorffii]|eukprot:XP_024516519.1 BURP domain-containing protein 14-like [Selaginella moellendorffii]